jgi:hypothetical protein
MRDEFVNRLGMFRTALGTLNRPEYRPVWFNRPPAVFTYKVQAAEQAVNNLAEFGRAQETATTGAAEQKQIEEKELEQEAYVFGGALAIWFRDQGDAENAAKVDLTLSEWRKLRDQQLLEKARLVQQLGEAVTTGPNASAAATYGITPAALNSLGKETNDYETIITAPQQAIAERKARTQQLRDRFNAVEGQFEILDRFIQLFRATPEGRDMIYAWQAARVIRDLGHGPSAAPAEP